MSWAKEQWKKSPERKRLEKIRKEQRKANSEKFIEENAKVWFDEEAQLWMRKHPFYMTRLATEEEIKAALSAAEGGEQ